MKKNYLGVTTQPSRGKTTTEEKGWGMLCVQKEGSELCQISVDTFEWVDYRERPEIKITFSFHDGKTAPAHLTIEELKQAIFLYQQTKALTDQ